MARQAASTENPIATAAQREREDVALRLVQRPELQKARMVAGFLWREGMRFAAADQMSRFDAMMDEYVFHYALRAAASDPYDPHAVRFMAPAHRWFGRDVPGSRWGGDCPDFIYRMIPIEHGGRFEIHCRPTCANPGSTHFGQMSDNTASPTILSLLDVLEMPLDGNGEFVLTADETPIADRRNHIQTMPGARQIWVRDAFGDWTGQSPCAITVRRLDTPKRGPLSDEELAQRAAKGMIDGVYFSYWIIQTCLTLPINEMSTPSSSAGFGGMPTQYTAKVNICLEPDEALIVTANGAGAGFRDFVPSDLFMLSINYWERLGSLNMAQMAADADGLFTYVVAHADPGVHNWIDTGGLRRLLAGHRWQAFGPEGPSEEPRITARTVKFADLGQELPAGVRRIDAEGRKAQIAERLRGYDRRFLDR